MILLFLCQVYEQFLDQLFTFLVKTYLIQLETKVRF